MKECLLSKILLKKGRLVIEFDVEFPSPGTFDEKTKLQLISLLSHQTELEEEDSNTNTNNTPLNSSTNLEVTNYTFSDYEELEVDSKAGKQAYEEDEEEEGNERNGAVGCRFM